MGCPDRSIGTNTGNTIVQEILEKNILDYKKRL